MEGRTGRDAKPTKLLCLSSFLNPKANQEIQWRTLEPTRPQAGCRERRDPSLRVSPPISSQTIHIVKYPISVAKMCFLTCVGARWSGRRAAGDARTHGATLGGGGPRDGSGCAGGLVGWVLLGRCLGGEEGLRAHGGKLWGCPWLSFQQLQGRGAPAFQWRRGSDCFGKTCCASGEQKASASRDLGSPPGTQRVFSLLTPL